MVQRASGPPNPKGMVWAAKTADRVVMVMETSKRQA